MEMTVGTVAAGLAPSQQGTANSSASSADFSEVLSGVRSQTAPAQTSQQAKQTQQPVQPQQSKQTADGAQDQAPAQVNQSQTGTSRPAEGAAQQSDDTAQSIDAAQVSGVTVTASAQAAAIEEISVKLEQSLVQLVVQLSGGDDEKEDRIIQMFLDYLKKLSEGGDETADLAMQMLMAMTQEQPQQTAQMFLSVQNVSAEVTAVSAEMSAVSVSFSMEERQELPAQAEAKADGQRQETRPEEHTDIRPEAQPAVLQETVIAQAAEAMPEQAVEAAAPVITEQAAAAAVMTETSAMPVPEAKAQPERQTVEAPQQQTESGAEIPQDTAFKMLGDILDKAREDLGLTKAEFTQTKPVQPEMAEQTEIVRQEQPVKAAGLELKPNHRDGRDELDTILGAGERKPQQQEKEELRVPEQNTPQAGLAESRLDSRTAPISEEPARTIGIPPERQLADEILSHSETMNGGRTEFTMVLNPESLGRITVRMASVGGRVEVSITAENDATRQLLESRSEQLGTALRSNGVELERYQVVGGQEQAQLMQDNYDGSSKNPYGRQDDGEQSGDEEGENDFLEILQQL